MKIIRKIKNQGLTPPVILTMGGFDGVHKGHQSILRKVAGRAGVIKGTSVLLSFDPVPLQVLKKRKQILLTTLQEKIALLEKSGIQVLILLRFDRRLAGLSPRKFLQEYVFPLGPKEIILGPNHTFGYKGKGNLSLLKKVAGSENFTVKALPLKKIKGVLVNSTRIRRLLQAGRIEQANQMLGRSFAIRGEVVSGKRRGKIIGFPTANIRVAQQKLIPGRGVYLARVEISSAKKTNFYHGLANIGYRPSFKERRKRPVIEVHVINFQKSLYGKSIGVELIKKIRDEKKFSHLQNLRKQIERDIKKCRPYLGGENDGK